MAKTRRLLAALAAVTIAAAGTTATIATRSATANKAATAGTLLDTLGARRCGQLSDMATQLSCYEKHFGQVLERDGYITAVSQVTAFHSDPSAGPFPMFCHEVLHQLGKDAIAAKIASGDNPVEVLANLSVTCTGGFAHGALSSYFDTLDVIDTMPTLCENLVATITAERTSEHQQQADNSWLRWNCDHMLGHAIFRAVSDNHAAESLAAGGALCDRIADETQLRGCVAGYYMEYFLDVAREPQSRAAAETPAGIAGTFWLCRQGTGLVARGCYGESGGLVYQRAGFDWQKSAEACAASGASDDNILACYESLGNNVAAYSGYEDAAMRAACSELKNVVARDACYIQIAGASAMELADGNAGRAICLEVSTTRRSECVENVSGTEDSLRTSGFSGGVAADW